MPNRLIFWCQILPFALLFFACAEQPANIVSVRTGLDQISSGDLMVLKGLRAGVITNQTGRDAAGRHVIDILHDNSDVELVALFGPEHGLRGSAEGGYKVETGRDSKTGLPIYSLYGQTRKPDSTMLAGLDALIFDIQDVGTRFYTYISTMSLAMATAADLGIKFIVLDRPNPLGGEIMEGPVLDPEHSSFIGIHPIPLRHGMTVGELARMFAGEGWVKSEKPLDPHVFKLRGWRRHMFFDDTGLNWIAPSPNMPTVETAIVYPGMGFIETTNFSEGRGTNAPFTLIGAPWLDAEMMISVLKPVASGLELSATTFTPVDMPGKATRNKFDQRLCQAIRLSVTDPAAVRPVALGTHLLAALRKHYPDSLEFRSARLTRFYGKEWISEALQAGHPAQELIDKWQPDLEDFTKKRAAYLLYP